MDLVSLYADAAEPAPKGCEWIPAEDIKKIALPSAMNAAVRAIREIPE